MIGKAITIRPGFRAYGRGRLSKEMGNQEETQGLRRDGEKIWGGICKA